jgi:urease accessory protein
LTLATIADNCPPSHDDKRWHGRLDLALQRCGDATRLTRRRHHGPLLVQRPFYPEGPSCCHIYLLHPPGGLVGGDKLVCNICLADDAHALVTTPSAGKAYRVAADRDEQGQSSHMQLSPGATLEWFPQETIAFNGSRPLIHTRIDFARSAKLIGWDILCLGRPSAGELFEQGAVRQQLELYCEDQPQQIEHALFEGASPMMFAPWGLRGQPVLGTLYCYHPQMTIAQSAKTPQLLALVRTMLTAFEDAHRPGPAQSEKPLLAATLVNNILLIRYLGACTEQCRQLFVDIWCQLRPMLLQRPARAPRIWNT